MDTTTPTDWGLGQHGPSVCATESPVWNSPFIGLTNRLPWLLDTGTECTLIYREPSKLQGGKKAVDGYGWKLSRQTSLYLRACRLPPHCFPVRTSPIPECILGVDVLQALDLR